MKFLPALFLLLLLPATASAVTWYVDDDNTTGPWLGTLADPFQFIQSGINAAAAWDIVHVMRGTYKENINFNGKAIWVRSDQGAWLTTIDGSTAPNPANMSTVTFWSGETSNSRLEGFTITYGQGTLINAYQHCGGGIICMNGSSPTIIDNVVVENKVDAFGGGIYCENDSTPNIFRNTVIENWADDDGAGIACWNCSPMIHNNLIIQNMTVASAGGIDCVDSNAIIVNNRIIQNVAGATGINADAGGVRTVGASFPTLTNNTICENKATWNGGGMECIGLAPTVTNCIFWDNQAGNAFPEIYDIAGGMAVTYCDVLGGYPGAGNINSNPGFVAVGDFHLMIKSPCIDAGNNFATYLPTYDFEGDPRKWDVPIIQDTGLGKPPMVDIGADEFHPHLYYTGLASPGNTVQVKIIGLPGTAPVGIVIGFNVFDPPLPSFAGPWYVAPPWLILGLPPIPGSGVFVMGGALPNAPPGPYTLYLQALVGAALTNLCIMNVL